MNKQEHEYCEQVLSGFFPAIRAMGDGDREHLIAAWGLSFSRSALFELNMDEQGFKMKFGKFVNILVPSFLVGGHTVYAEVGKDYGSVTVKFGMSHAAQTGSENVAFQAALDNIAAEHTRFQLERWAAGTEPRTNQPSRDTEIILGSRISVEVRDGKHFFKLHGGKYEKYGVRLWPEVAKAAGLQSVPLEGMDLPPCDVTIELNGGQPKRVLKIEWHNA